MAAIRRPRIVGWAGHRPDVFAERLRARRAVDRAVEAIFRAGEPCEFVCGGQRGVDQWAARAALRRGIPVRFVLPWPVPDFTAGWSEQERSALVSLLSRAASVEIADEAGMLGRLAYDLRNEAITRYAHMLVVVWGGIRQGGTFYTVCSAHARGIPVEEVRLPLRVGFALEGRGL